MANYGVEREREINEIGRDVVAANNKKHAMKVQKRKEDLAKKVSPEMKSFARHFEKSTGEKIKNRHEK